MQLLHRKSALVLDGVTTLLTVAIFLLDLWMPAGPALWLLYAIPFALSWSSLRAVAPWAFAGLITLLVLIGHLLSPPEQPVLSSLLNRLIGIGLLWSFMLAPVGRRPDRTQADAHGWNRVQTHPRPRVDRLQAESTSAAAVEAPAHAEAIIGAVAGQRRAEDVMCQERLRFEGIVQSAMDAIITLDEELNIVLFNQAAERMFEWNAGDMLGRPLDRLMPEQFRGAHGGHIRQFGRSGMTTRRMGTLGIITGVRASGEEFPIEAAISHHGMEGARYYTVILRDITQRMRLEKELAEREALLRAIIETEPECVTMLGLDGTVRSMNAAGLAMAEAANSLEIIGTDACKLVAPEFRSAFKELLRKVGQGEAGQLEFEIVGLQGTRRWLETHVVPLRGASGTISSVLGVTRDVTQRKQAERSLRHSEERYRRLLSVLPDAVLFTRENRILFVNEQALRLFGAEQREDLLRKSLADCLHPNSHVLAGDRPPQLLRNGEVVPEVEGKIVRLDGMGVAVEVRAARFNDEMGIGTLVVLRDITTRQQAEQRLRESEERLQSLLSSMEDVIWSSSLDLSRVGYVSPSVSEVYGRPSEDFVTHPALWLEVVHPEDRPIVEQALRDLRTTGEFDVEYRIVRLDGGIRWLHDRRRIITDTDGKALRVDGIVSDVTERKRLQTQLRRTERIAELGTVASGMAHEIGTPMNVILGRAEYLMERTKEEPVKKGLQTIVVQVERITRVMNQLLAFARRRPVEHRALDLRQTIEDNLEIFHERLAHNNITVETSFAEDCTLVHADADQMSQVLINLVMNAIHAMPDGGVLKLDLAADGDMIRLTVADRGHGIPPEVISKIFDPFFTTKEFGKGTGLGLTVVKGIIEEHSGTIHVESEPHTGTIFTIRLPIHHDSQN